MKGQPPSVVLTSMVFAKSTTMLMKSTYLVFLIIFANSADGSCVASPHLMAAELNGALDNYCTDMDEQSSTLTCTEQQRQNPFRSIDGTCNNLENPYFGASRVKLNRLLQPVYDDGVNSPRTRGVSGLPLRSARDISLTIHGNPAFPPRPSRPFTLLLMQWGQFLDHDFALVPLPTEGGVTITCCDNVTNGFLPNPPEECFPILITDSALRGPCRQFVRSVAAKPQFPGEKREQINQPTSFIDGSMVYGSDEERLRELREGPDGTGYLLRFEPSPFGELLPSTTARICNQPLCFLAGDERPNEQPSLATIHTLFLRLHNRIARAIKAEKPGLSNTTIFDNARRLVGGVIQNIMFAEWLPIILGPSSMARHRLIVTGRSVYNQSVDATLFNAFSSAAFRLGHSLIPDELPAFSSNLAGRSLLLREHFMNPTVVRTRINDLAMGLFNAQDPDDQSQPFDSVITGEVINHLFEVNGVRGTGYDLMSFNIQRSRDHGVPPYNRYREFCGLPVIRDFQHLGVALNLASPLLEAVQSVYENVNDIELIVGGFLEPPFGGGLIGATLNCLVSEQMRRLKFGDRFFFTHLPGRTITNPFTNEQLSELRKVTAAVVMCQTIPGLSSIQADAFRPVSRTNPLRLCQQLNRNFINVDTFLD